MRETNKQETLRHERPGERKFSPHHEGNEVWVCAMNRLRECAVLIYMRDSTIFPYMTMRVYTLDKASSSCSRVPFTLPRRYDFPFPVQGTTIHGDQLSCGFCAAYCGPDRLTLPVKKRLRYYYSSSHTVWMKARDISSVLSMSVPPPDKFISGGRNGKGKLVFLLNVAGRMGRDFSVRTGGGTTATSLKIARGVLLSIVGQM